VRAAIAGSNASIDALVNSLPQDHTATFDPGAISAVLFSVQDKSVRKALQDAVDSALTQLSTQAPVDQAAAGIVTRLTADANLKDTLTDLTRSALAADVETDRAAQLISSMQGALPPELANLTPDSAIEALQAANKLTTEKTLSKPAVVATSQQLQTLINNHATDDQFAKASLAEMEGAPVQLNTAIHSILDAIKNNDLTLQSQKAAEALADLSDVKATSDILASMLTPIDPKLAGYVSDVGNIYDAVDGAIGDFADGDIDVIDLTGDILSGVGILDKLFGGGSQGATALVSSQLDRLQTQLSALNDIVIKGFAHIDESLSKIYTAINQGFADMKTRINEIGTNQAIMLDHLASIDTTLYNINTNIDAHFNDLVSSDEQRTRDGCLEYVNRFRQPTDAIPFNQYNSCISFFKTLATEFAADSNHTSSVDSSLTKLGDLQDATTAKSLILALQSPVANPNVVAKMLYLLGDDDYHDLVLPHDAGGAKPPRIPNGYVWMSAVTDMQTFRQSWSKYYGPDRVEVADAVAAMRASGNLYMTAVRPLITKMEPWTIALAYYKRTLVALIDDYKSVDHVQQNSFSKKSAFVTSADLWQPATTPPVAQQPTFNESFELHLNTCGEPAKLNLDGAAIKHWFPSYALLAEDLGIASVAPALQAYYVQRHGSPLGIDVTASVQFTSDFYSSMHDPKRQTIFIRAGDAVGLPSQDNGCAGEDALNTYLTNNWTAGANLQSVVANSPNAQTAICISAPRLCPNGVYYIDADFYNLASYAQVVPSIEIELANVRSKLGPQIIDAVSKDPAKSKIAMDALQMDVALALVKAMANLSLQPWMNKDPRLVGAFHSSSLSDSAQMEQSVINAYRDMTAYSVHVVDLLTDIKEATKAENEALAKPITAGQSRALYTAMNADVDSAIARYYARSANHELIDTLGSFDEATAALEKSVSAAIASPAPGDSPIQSTLAILKAEDVDYYIVR
jgi:hypothetical protein